jgi:mannosyltransferase OCH1-like enzyme
MNPDYDYQFYDDNRVEAFFNAEFEPRVLHLYQKIKIGAAKADMFRYAILLKKGGVYLDIDSTITARLDKYINPLDQAIISRERHPGLFVQWALIFAPHHPFMQKTMNKIIQNIEENKYPNDVHRMTGPTVYSEAINECIAENPDVPYRILGTDYDSLFRFKYRFHSLFYNKKEHWKKMQLTMPVLKEF